MNFGEIPVYAVSEVNQYIKGLLDGDGLLQGLLVRGEISNYKRYPSGHHYFSLKDANGAIRCVLFQRDAAHLRFRPENGMQVVAFGRVSVFPRDGQYQLYCAELFPDGAGDLNAAFERLKEKLAAEGVFDEENKQPIPKFPKKIALVTSPAGAAVRDMLRILKARWPMAEVLLAPVRVQGAGAAAEIAAAIHALNNRADIDLIITGRGGGSMEDLWAFNEEIVARAIYISNIPVISAVGHEPDVTIADYAADVRAATPSNGAQLAVPDQDEVRQVLDHLQARLSGAVSDRLELQRQRLDRLKNARVLQTMLAPVEHQRQMLGMLRRRLGAAASSSLAGGRGELVLRRGRLLSAGKQLANIRRADLSRLCAGLEAMSPLKVLSRGYAVPRTEKGVVSSVTQVGIGEHLELLVTDGRLKCQVEEKEIQHGGKKAADL